MSFSSLSHLVAVAFHALLLLLVLKHVGPVVVAPEINHCRCFCCSAQVSLTFVYLLNTGITTAVFELPFLMALVSWFPGFLM